MNKISSPSVPVLMFHSISNSADKLAYGKLSISLELFCMMISYLHKHNFNTITFDELYNYLRLGHHLPPKPIIISFDDGYLDNWVNAFPILKKYGMRATIFVVPDFVDHTTDVRPTLLDVWKGKATSSELSDRGFLSWNEMKEMANSGLVNIQSHSLTHTYIYQGNEIIDFHHPGDKYPWLAWNKYPDRKYLWPLEDQEEFIEFGTPIYSYGRALAAPEYTANKSICEYLVHYVKVHGGRGFFKEQNWKDHLFHVVEDYSKNNSSEGKYETLKEYEERVRNELILSKELIERNIGEKVNFLCWPGGAFNQMSQRIAQEVGYSATTKGSSRNIRGADPRRIDRISAHVTLTRIHPLVDRYISLLVFVAKVEGYRGNLLHSNFLQLSLRTVHAYRWFMNHRNRKD